MNLLRIFLITATISLTACSAYNSSRLRGPIYLTPAQKYVLAKKLQERPGSQNQNN